MCQPRSPCRAFLLAWALGLMPAMVAAQSPPESDSPPDAIEPVGSTATSTAAVAAPAEKATAEGQATDVLPHAPFVEPPIVRRGISIATTMLGADGSAPGTGFYPEFGNMITGSGFVSAGPGYRHLFLDERLTIDASAAVSWHFYNSRASRHHPFGPGPAGMRDRPRTRYSELRPYVE